jgi:hypothetical protein
MAGKVQRILRSLVRALVLVLLLCALAVAALHQLWLSRGEEWVEQQVRSQLDSRLAVPYEIEGVSAGLLSGIGIDGLVIGREGEEPLIEADRVRLGLELAPLLRRELRIDSFTLRDATIRLDSNEHGIPVAPGILRRLPPGEAPAREGPPPLPEVIEIRNARFVLDPEGSWVAVAQVTVEELAWHLGEGSRYRLDATISTPSLGRVRVRGVGETPAGRLDLEARAGRVEVGPALAGLLGERARTSWELLRPDGTVSAEGRLSLRDGALESWSAALDLDGLRLQPRDLSLEALLTDGVVHLGAGGFRFDPGVEGTIRLEGARVPFRVSGEGGFGSRDALEMSASVEDLPIDSRLERALAGVGARFWEDYRPGGSAGVRAILRRAKGAGVASLEAEAVIRDGEVTHVEFPYTVQDVTGRVRLLSGVDLAGGAERFPGAHLLFEELKGTHRSSDTEVHLDRGLYHIRDESGGVGELQLPFRSPGALVDEDLLAALRPEVERVVRDLGLEGRPAANVLLVRPAGGTLDVRVEARVEEPVGVRWEDFPYPVRLSRGWVRYEREAGRVDFGDLATDPGSAPRFAMGGSLRPDPAEGGDHLRIDIAIGEDGAPLALDDPLLQESLPEGVRSVLLGRGVGGHLRGGVAVDVHLGERAEGERASRLSWSAEMRLAEGWVDLGLEIEDIEATLSMSGSHAKPGVTAWSISTSDGSLRVAGALVQEIAARLDRGPGRALAPRAASLREPGERISARETTGSALVDRMDETEEVLLVRLEQGDAYDGTVSGFLLTALDTSDYEASLDVHGLDLGPFHGDIRPDPDPVSGTLAAEFHAAGNLSAPGSVAGWGALAVEDGDIGSLPVAQVFLRHTLFGVLRMSEGQRVVREGVLRFRIAGDRIVVDRYRDFQLKAGAARAVGKGHLTFDGQLDLRLEPRGSLYGLPIVGQALDRVMGVRIRGPIWAAKAVEEKGQDPGPDEQEGGSQ